MLCLYFTGYGLGRFLVEGLRSDSLYVLPGLRVSQVLSLVLIIIGVILWFVVVNNNKTEKNYAGKYKV